MSAVLTPADRSLAEQFALGHLDAYGEEAIQTNPSFDHAVVRAEEKLIADEHEMGDWLACMGDDREQQIKEAAALAVLEEGREIGGAA